MYATLSKKSRKNLRQFRPTPTKLIAIDPSLACLQPDLSTTGHDSDQSHTSRITLPDWWPLKLLLQPYHRTGPWAASCRQVIGEEKSARESPGPIYRGKIKDLTKI